MGKILAVSMNTQLSGEKKRVAHFKKLPFVPVVTARAEDTDSDHKH